MVVAALKTVDSVRTNELGRQICTRSSPMKQTPQPKGRGGKKNNYPPRVLKINL